MMHVLSIAPYQYLPARQGGEIFIAGYYAALARYCRLTVVSVQANRPDASLPYALRPVLSNGRLRYINIFYCRQLAKAIRQKNVQLLQIEHPYLGWMAVWLQARTGRPFVVHSHNIEAARFRSIGKVWWPLLRAYEKWVHRKAAHSFFISREDADTAIGEYGLSPQKVSVAPYGITAPPAVKDMAALRRKVCERHNIAPGSTIYYFNGALGYQPNQQAVRNILTAIAPRLQQAAGFPYVILISGKGLPPALAAQVTATNGQVVYTGFVNDITEYFAAADVFINPVMEGGGVKTKVLEALAFHKTVISTASGAIGVHTAVCGGKLQVANDNNWEQFITLMLQRANIAVPTPPSFFEYYNSSNIAKDAAAIMASIIRTS
ncbi:MAG TPA: glycosyltransferase family 4 protein [Chitinophaga sp.]|uniref:glycosyltransferase family 4 protein n=1 Tax=Chitinophaga sp. TaxID=1869181 RepID=UPI002DB62EC4|nr:glycosyltransferase family 4 protein [Chitinophaga sp.]HEU4555754.1 glycosyltransferase family 4 protein [Chitinophaga sp.]